MSRDTKNSVSICGERLKKVMENKLDALGSTGLEILFDEMQDYGFRFHKDATYTMEQLHSFLVKTFGEDGSTIIVKRIAKAIGQSPEKA